MIRTTVDNTAYMAHFVCLKALLLVRPARRHTKGRAY